jgi:hypothetical protein
MSIQDRFNPETWDLEPHSKNSEGFGEWLDSSIESYDRFLAVVNVPCAEPSVIIVRQTTAIYYKLPVG